MRLTIVSVCIAAGVTLAACSSAEDDVVQELEDKGFTNVQIFGDFHGSATVTVGTCHNSVYLTPSRAILQMPPTLSGSTTVKYQKEG